MERPKMSRTQRVVLRLTPLQVFFGMLALVAMIVVMAKAAKGQPAPTQPARSAMGINLGGITDYDHLMYADAVRNSRPFGSPTSPGSTKEDDSPAFDENGWPLGDFGMTVFTDWAGPVGDYQVQMVGPCTSIKPTSSNAQVLNLKYDQATNLTTATVRVPESARQLFLSFRGTNGGTKSLHVWVPGSTPGDLFMPEIVQGVRGLGHVRFMALGETNNSGLSLWSDRAKITDAQRGLKGAPYEEMLDLCDQTGANPWICVPDQADDDFVRNLATLVKERLGRGPPWEVVYIEHSNEVWNWQFQQAKRNWTATQQEIAAGDPNKLKTVQPNNADAWRMSRHAFRTLHIGEIFKQIVEPRKVRVVLGSQSAFPELTEWMLSYIEQVHGKPANLIYGVAVAPYLNVADPNFTKRTDLTPEIVASAIRSAGETYFPPTSKIKRAYDACVAKSVALLMYEGGVDLGQNNISVDAKKAAMLLPDTAAGQTAYYDRWFALGPNVRLASQFTLASQHGKYGFWGLMGNRQGMDVPRVVAYKQQASRYVADPTPPLPPPPDPMIAVRLAVQDARQKADRATEASREAAEALRRAEDAAGISR